MSWWPKFVYHFTDVLNGVSILESGFLFSRAEAINRSLMNVDNASPEVIQQTLPEYQRFARLYFRPRTPTQYRNEGVRPIGQREMGGAHCPIPTYFCFDALNVLSRDETEFSDGNMGSPRARHSSEHDFFSAIPFNLVFHNGAITQNEDKDEIIFRRHAEILVPNLLPIEQDLKVIFCRSSAERSTFLHRLSADAQKKWSNKIRVDDLGFFNRKWTYVEEVVIVDDRIIFRFNPNTITPGPFTVHFTYLEDGQNRLQTWNGRIEQLNNTLGFRISGAIRGVATLKLDDSIVYDGRIIFVEIPF